MDFDDLDIAAQSSLQDLKTEIQLADPATLRLLMTQARTFNAWQDKSVSIETLNQVYQIMKMGPTSGNCCPARLVFLTSKEAKERLQPALKPNNIETVSYTHLTLPTSDLV